MKTILLSLLIAFSSTLIASDLGKKTYEMTCQTCHDPRFAPGMHAPAAFNKQAWAIRFNKAIMESKNNPTRFKTAIDYLLYKVGTGKGLMPHGGLCKEADASNKNCSDEAIAAAIYYMAGMPTDN
ncbi:putative Cytochrome c, class I precursor [Legionella donaldsonii]|uniref:Putative Cytochrome c, class I n=1 Tax=Legionella donaldsonii TaxID=45060 RepID=A0A378J8T6_9GAMM|nr:c-type cytochrome [Legionella donaldsonii]STX44213.1 putative Cytochrome c, class I precursor [Legionella donaldsonii]